MKANNRTRPTDPHNLAVRPIFAPTSPLEYALTKNLPASALESALAESLDLIPPEMNTYTKQGGYPPVFHRIVNSNTARAGTTPFVPGKSSAVERPLEFVTHWKSHPKKFKWHEPCARVREIARAGVLR